MLDFGCRWNMIKSVLLGIEYSTNLPLPSRISQGTVFAINRVTDPQNEGRVVDSTVSTFSMAEW